MERGWYRSRFAEWPPTAENLAEAHGVDLSIGRRPGEFGLNAPAGSSSDLSEWVFRHAVEEGLDIGALSLVYGLLLSDFLRVAEDPGSSEELISEAAVALAIRYRRLVQGVGQRRTDPDADGTWVRPGADREATAPSGRLAFPYATLAREPIRPRVPARPRPGPYARVDDGGEALRTAWDRIAMQSALAGSEPPAVQAPGEATGRDDGAEPPAASSSSHRGSAVQVPADDPEHADEDLPTASGPHAPQNSTYLRFRAMVYEEADDSEDDSYSRCLTCGAPAADLLGGMECWECYGEH